MRIRFWGTRGSIAAPGPHTVRYGGNTACVEVRADDGTLIVLDCGTGARDLGLHLAHTADQPLRINLFVGHTHWDHIQGFPFFVPAFLPTTELNIYAPLGFQRGLEEALAGQMEYAYFPVKLRELRSRIHFTELEEGFFRVGDVLVETQYLNHTAPTIAYRLSSSGATVAYVTDHEPFWSVPAGVSAHPGDERHVAFLRNAGLVIHDAQYTEEEYRDKVGWGHSSVRYAVEVAAAAGVARLVLFHHDPAHDDAAMDAILAEARRCAERHGGAPTVLAAREGLELEVRGAGGVPAVGPYSALQRRPIAGGRVAFVGAAEAQAAALEDGFDEDGLLLLRLPDLAALVARAPRFVPDLAIVDQAAVDGDLTRALETLRARLGRSNFPVVVLVDPAADAVDRVAGPATDFLAKPFSPPMLRARVRAWLARTLTPFEARPAAPAAAGGAASAGTRLAGLVESVALFRSLSAEQRELLATHAAEEVFAPGHTIFAQGDPSHRLFVILAGRVRVLETTPDTQAELLIGELAEGELFGEVGVLRNQTRSATVVAAERTHCLVLQRDAFLRALQGNAEFALALLRMLAGRLYDADRRLSRYAPDPVTGLPGRRAFLDQYRRLAAVARRRRTGALLLVLDVRRLRTINDRWGYGVGDDVLRAVADALLETTRTTDLVARVGGDEFAVLLTDARQGDAEAVLGRVRDRLVERAAKRGLPVVPECNVGVAFSAAPPETPDDLLGEADRDMRRRAAS